MDEESSLINLIENITPASQTLYNYLNSQDIAKLSLTSKQTKDILNTYISNNNSKFIKDQIYNIYLDSLCYLMYSLVMTYTINEDFIVSLNGNNDTGIGFVLSQSMVGQRYNIDIYINNSSNNRNLVEYVDEYLKSFNMLDKPQFNEFEEDDVSYHISTDLNLYEFTYFIKNFKPFQEEKTTFYYDDVGNAQLDTNEAFEKNMDLLDYYLSIKNVFHPTKSDLIYLLNMLNVKIDLSLSSEQYVLKDLALKYNYLFKNRDFINFINNTL